MCVSRLIKILIGKWLELWSSLGSMQYCNICLVIALLPKARLRVLFELPLDQVI
jgi:hypothetical protein